MRLTLLILLLSSYHCFALSDFEAEYQILKDGKVTGQQKTTFKVASPQTYILKDTTKGTKGLASMLGFKRTETTELEFTASGLNALNHQMQQKISFKKKRYHFKKTDNTYIGKHKGDTFQTEDINVLSSHAIPIGLSLISCQQPGQHQFTVLKSERSKVYNFQSQLQGDGLIRVDRIYSPERKRTTSIWLDPKQNCLPIKSRHQEDGEDPIETRLLNLTIKNNLSASTTNTSN
ncbi:hypothetical protein [Marinicella sp. W31]|uniref:hypothetical protein n=1 Tax=Marinicella sp. W31 TaxID=3023713 RepID=UPI0037573C34